MAGATGRNVVVWIFTVGTFGSFAQSSDLRVTVLEGEAALNDIRSRRAKEPVVRVEDSTGEPLSGAVVNFILPSHGAGGTFDGEMSLTVTTGVDGKAVGRGLRPNKVAGPFRIRVTASVRGEAATATINQTNVAPAATGANTKKIGLIAVIGGAALGGIIAATRGGGNSAPGPTAGTGGVTGGTTVTPGTPGFGPPR